MTEEAAAEFICSQLINLDRNFESIVDKIIECLELFTSSRLEILVPIVMTYSKSRQA